MSYHRVWVALFERNRFWPDACDDIGDTLILWELVVNDGVP